MKKLLSAILALTMGLSIFTFTAHAGTAGTYNVSYEAISVASGDVNNLAKGDTLFVVVTLKDAEGFFSGGVGLNWNSKVLTPVDSSGNEATALGKITASRADSTMKKYSDDMGEDVTVFGRTGLTKFAADSFYYELANTGEFAGQDYLLDGDLVMLKVRLKVIGEGDANITAGTSKLQETKADGVVGYPTINVTSFTVGSDEEEVTYDPKNFTVDFEYGVKAAANTGLALNFKQVDAEDVVKEDTVEVPFTSMVGSTFEAAMNVVLGVTVKDVPSNVTLTLEGADWYLAE